VTILPRHIPGDSLGAVPDLQDRQRKRTVISMVDDYELMVDDYEPKVEYWYTEGSSGRGLLWFDG
jgi:hypothetical protein